jgi:hypothetical protein
MLKNTRAGAPGKRRGFESTVLGVCPTPAASFFMVLKIFLDDKGFHCLKRCIPRASHSKIVVEEAMHLTFFGSNTVLTCNEAEARNLLIYASHCPTAVASIHKAFRSAGLPIEKVD